MSKIFKISQVRKVRAQEDEGVEETSRVYNVSLEIEAYGFENNPSEIIDVIKAGLDAVDAPIDVLSSSVKP